MAANKKYETKIYNPLECCVFRKTKEGYGALSNMASGFPILVNGINVKSAEALYQACRYPHMPEVQEKILLEKSPMTAKMVGKPFRELSRPDWEEERVKIMRWCLRVKLAQNFWSFGKVLESTFNKPIVEESNKDPFWGAIPEKHDKTILKGVNALGRLLMELRQTYNDKRYHCDLFVIEPLKIPDFKLMGFEITCIDERQHFAEFIEHSLRMNEVTGITKENNSKISSLVDLQKALPPPKKVSEKVKKQSKKSGEQGSFSF